MSREEDYKRVSAMAGYDEHGCIAPPLPGAKLDLSPSPYWKTASYGSKCPLNERELLVVRLLAEGKRQKQIAHELDTHHTGVFNLLAAIRDKMGFRWQSPCAIVAHAVREKWIA